MSIEKKKKAIMVAIAYYLEKERSTKSNLAAINQAWSEQARRRTIQDHENVQRRGRFLLK